MTVHRGFVEEVRSSRTRSYKIPIVSEKVPLARDQARFFFLSQSCSLLRARSTPRMLGSDGLVSLFQALRWWKGRKYPGEAGRLGRERGGLESRPVHISSRHNFSSFPLSESLEQATVSSGLAVFHAWELFIDSTGVIVAMASSLTRC